MEKRKKKLQEPCVTGTPETWDCSNEKMNGKLSKNVPHSTQHNCENRSTMAEKKVIKVEF